MFQNKVKKKVKPKSGKWLSFLSKMETENFSQLKNIIIAGEERNLRGSLIAYSF